MLSYIINVRQDNRFLYSSTEPGQPLPSVPHPLIRGNRIQRHTGSGFTWLTFNYNYGSLMPINCHIAALVTIGGDWSLMRSTSQIRRKLKKTTSKLWIYHDERIGDAWDRFLFIKKYRNYVIIAYHFRLFLSSKAINLITIDRFIILRDLDNLHTSSLQYRRMTSYNNCYYGISYILW